MLKELLEHGADPRLSDSAAVVAAASSGNVEAMLLLIEHGADIHVQQGVPGNALHIAARNCNINMVELLLGQGVDVNSFGGYYGFVIKTPYLLQSEIINADGGQKKRAHGAPEQ